MHPQEFLAIVHHADETIGQAPTTPLRYGYATQSPKFDVSNAESAYRIPIVALGDRPHPASPKYGRSSVRIWGRWPALQGRAGGGGSILLLKLRMHPQEFLPLVHHADETIGQGKTPPPNSTFPTLNPHTKFPSSHLGEVADRPEGVNTPSQTADAPTGIPGDCSFTISQT